MRTASTKGFTLIELSIVLVIIGLLVGGILVGHDLIRAAEIRATVKQIEDVNTAVMTFRLKYNALPGDMQNATQYWGAIDSDPATCIDAVRTDTATCDGNGDGRLKIGAGLPIHEEMLFWQHLQNANLIGQNFRGGPCGNVNTPREDFMLKTKLRSTYFMGVGGSYFGNIDAALRFGNNYLVLGGGYGTSCLSSGTVIYPMDAFGIDSKIDDGLPASGRVSSMIGFGITDCRNFSTPQQYEVTNTSGSNNCALVFKTTF